MADDLISRHAAIGIADAVWSITGDKNVAKVWDQLNSLPIAQERKKGKWLIIMDDPRITFDECKCSECGVVEYFNKGWKKFNYCPNCGSLMKGEGDGV